MARIVITLEIDDRLIQNSNARFSLPQLITSRPAAGVSAVATDREVEASAERGAQVVERMPVPCGPQLSGGVRWIETDRTIPR